MAARIRKIRRSRRLPVGKSRNQLARLRKRKRERVAVRDIEARRSRWLPLVAVALGIGATVLLGQIAAWLARAEFAAARRIEPPERVSVVDRGLAVEDTSP